MEKIDTLEMYLGEIGPPVLAFLVVAVTQWIKTRFGWEGAKAEILSVGLSYFFFGTFYVIVTMLLTPPRTGWEMAWMVFKTIVYPAWWWFSTQGIYGKAKQLSGK